MGRFFFFASRECFGIDAIRPGRARLSVVFRARCVQPAGGRSRVTVKFFFLLFFFLFPRAERAAHGGQLIFQTRVGRPTPRHRRRRRRSTREFRKGPGGDGCLSPGPRAMRRSRDQCNITAEKKKILLTSAVHANCFFSCAFFFGPVPLTPRRACAQQQLGPVSRIKWRRGAAQGRQLRRPARRNTASAQLLRSRQASWSAQLLRSRQARRWSLSRPPRPSRSAAC